MGLIREVDSTHTFAHVLTHIHETIQNRMALTREADLIRLDCHALTQSREAASIPPGLAHVCTHVRETILIPPGLARTHTHTYETFQFRLALLARTHVVREADSIPNGSRSPIRLGHARRAHETARSP